MKADGHIGYQMFATSSTYELLEVFRFGHDLANLAVLLSKPVEMGLRVHTMLIRPILLIHVYS